MFNRVWLVVLLVFGGIAPGCDDHNSTAAGDPDTNGTHVPFFDVVIDLGSHTSDSFGFSDVTGFPGTDISDVTVVGNGSDADTAGVSETLPDSATGEELPDWNPFSDSLDDGSLFVDGASDVEVTSDVEDEVPDAGETPTDVIVVSDGVFECPGGLGCVCSADKDCLSNVCFQTNTDSICVHPCVLGGMSTCAVVEECLTAECDPLLGCLAVPTSGACSDGNACTTGDSCKNGQCRSGVAVVCLDGNLCTSDSCDPQTGCQFLPQTGPCDDFDPCTTQDQCQNGSCVGNGLFECEDNNSCTDDLCVKLVGCQHLPNKKPCDDGSLCSINDICIEGSCAGGGAVICNDNNPCTSDACVAQTGCVYSPNALSCNDNDACTGNDVCSGGVCAGTKKLCVTLADLWNDTAKLQEDKTQGPFGGSFAMHFISPWWDGTTYWTYYIANYVAAGIGRSATGLATSPNGVNFTNKGIAMDIGGAWQWEYDAKKDLAHVIGKAGVNGWEASTATDPPGHMSYGPYTLMIPSGPNTASFVLQIDNNSADTKKVVTLDVFDATDQQILASRDVFRNEFSGVFSDQIFNLNFNPQANHSLEFRVYWHDIAWILHKTVAVSQGQSPFFDDRLASFPGVWKEGNTWYLVYEGAGLSSSWPGDIGLATSTDGVTWIKSAANPILKHQTTGWEKVNIGTPSLWKKGSTWYLFYHGFDGKDVQIGVATGTDLKTLVRHPQNPIIKTGVAGSWDSGTVGWRSIIAEGNDYYMVFEGSTDPPYDVAKWSSGIARSTDLLNWTKWSKNPVLVPTTQGFGQDGPSWLKTPDQKIHVYFRKPGNQTHRATLTAK
ncbi:MAG: hypothetical protein HUU55_00825 [Myxococcales bacterium]|nr:hypothetical protein [Myxococcales bacterium]